MRLYYLYFLSLYSSILQAQDCPKAWLFYEERSQLRAQVLERQKIDVPLDKIQIDFLGYPVGLPYFYAKERKYPLENTVKRESTWLHSKASASLDRLNSLAKEKGIAIKINSSYRSHQHQEVLFKKYGTRRAELPGYSEHHLHTTIDIANCSTNSRCFLFLLENGFELGWVPSYYFRIHSPTIKESWHWRYIGLDAAKKFWCAWREDIWREKSRLRKLYPQ